MSKVNFVVHALQTKEIFLSLLRAFCHKWNLEESQCVLRINSRSEDRKNLVVTDLLIKKHAQWTSCRWWPDKAGLQKASTQSEDCTSLGTEGHPGSFSNLSKLYLIPQNKVRKRDEQSPQIISHSPSPWWNDRNSTLPGFRKVTRPLPVGFG